LNKRIDILRPKAQKPLSLIPAEHQQRTLLGGLVTQGLVEPGVDTDAGVPFDLDVEAVEYALDISHAAVFTHHLGGAPCVLRVEEVTGDLYGFALSAFTFLTGL
jgi:hypothetical protein